MGTRSHISALHAWFAKRIIGIGFVLSIAGIVGLVVFAFSVHREEYASDRWVFHTGEVIAALERLQLRITAAESTGRAFLITTDPKFVSDYDALAPLIREELKAFRERVADNVGMQQLAAELERAIDRRFATLERQIGMRRDGMQLTMVVPLSLQGVIEMQAIERITGKMREVEQQVLTERLSARREAQAHVSLAVLISGFAVAVMLSVVFFYTRHLWKLLERAEASARDLSHKDPLTGLPNRRLLTDRLQIAIAHARRHRTRVALLCLDLDGFKEINDTFGHEGGDQVLSAVGGRLSQTVRGEDTVARFGGDEFVVMLVEVDHDGAILVAEKIIAALRQPFTIGDRRASVAASVGVSLYPTHGLEEQTLLKNADVALYRAKRAGKSRYAMAELVQDATGSDHRLSTLTLLDEAR